MSRIAAVLALLCLSACATPAPTVFAPAPAPGAVGFTDYRIEADRWRITFRGGPGAPPEQVADYALLRAADLALAQGYDWFRVTGREGGVVARDSGPRVSLGVGGASFGHRSGVGVDVSRSFNLGAGPALAQSLEVLFGKGPAPRDPEVYDAREVRRNIGPRT